MKMLSCLLVVALGGALPAAPALAQSLAMPAYTLPQSRGSTGTRLAKDVLRVHWVTPEKTYAELDEMELAQVRSIYPELGPQDEPPYPLRGLLPMLRGLARQHEQAQVPGLLSLRLHIDAQGNILGVSTRKTPDPEKTNFLASALVRERFKPALCKGRPCAQVFPIEVELLRMDLSIDNTREIVRDSTARLNTP